MKYTCLECPTCGTKAVTTEKTPNGKVGCFKGHWWKHEDSANYHQIAKVVQQSLDKQHRIDITLGRMCPLTQSSDVVAMTGVSDETLEQGGEQYFGKLMPNFPVDCVGDNGAGHGIPILESDYWKERCLLAEEFISDWSDNTPCIFRDTLHSYKKWQEKIEVEPRTHTYDTSVKSVITQSGVIILKSNGENS